MQALGLSDVLRAELQPCQLAGIVNELEQLRLPLVKSFEAAVQSWNGLASRNGIDPVGLTAAAEAEAERAAYALRVLDGVRGELPTEPPDEPFAIVGPTAIVSRAIAAAARNAAAGLAKVLGSTTRPDDAGDRRLRQLATATYAWVETDIDRRSLEWYSFDPDFDLPPEL